MSRDLTRADVRTVVRMGLERTSGNYKLVTELFNMQGQEYKRFLGFLRKDRLPGALSAIPVADAHSRP